MDGIESGLSLLVRFCYQMKPVQRRRSVKQITIEAPIKAMNETSMVLEELIREGARKMLKAALEAGVVEHRFACACAVPQRNLHG